MFIRFKRVAAAIYTALVSLAPLGPRLASDAGEGKAGAVIGAGALGAVGIGRLMMAAEHSGSAVSHLASTGAHVASEGAYVARASGSALHGLGEGAEHLGTSGLGRVGSGAVGEAEHASALAAFAHEPDLHSLAMLPTLQKPAIVRAVEHMPVTMSDSAGRVLASSAGDMPALTRAFRRSEAALLQQAIGEVKATGKVTKLGLAAALRRDLARHANEGGVLFHESTIDLFTGKLRLALDDAGHTVWAESDVFDLVDQLGTIASDASSLADDDDK